jgi:hypothetical protein
VEIVQTEMYGPIHLRAIDTPQQGLLIESVEGIAQEASAADARLLEESAGSAAADEEQEHEELDP